MPPWISVILPTPILIVSLPTDSLTVAHAQTLQAEPHIGRE